MEISEFLDQLLVDDNNNIEKIIELDKPRFTLNYNLLATWLSVILGNLLQYLLAPSTEGKPKSDLKSNFGYEFSTCVFSHQAPCYQHLIAPGLSSNVRSYTVSVNKQSNKTFQQEFVCDSESDQCSYTWNVSDHEAVNYMVSVAANNVVGQSVTKNCTTTLIGQQLLLVELVQNVCVLFVCSHKHLYGSILVF